MGEQHLDFLPLAARGFVRLGLGDVAGEVACAFMDRAQNVAGGALGSSAASVGMARSRACWPG